VPKNTLDFQVPKFWQSISQDIEIIDEELDEDEGDETTTHHEPHPFFEEEQTHMNETTQLGNDVYLHCRVQNLGEKTVSKPAGISHYFFIALQRHESHLYSFITPTHR
jgi:hypothetical protein